MPVDNASCLAVVSSNLASAGLTGVSLVNLSSAIANGLSTYLVSGVSVVTVDSGVLGLGYGTGKANILPATALPIFTSFFVSNGIKGISAPLIATAVCNSFVTIINTAVVSTVSPTVGVGAGSGGLIGSTSNPYFAASFSSAGLAGAFSPIMVTAISLSVDSCIPTAVVNVAITGSGSSVPSSGIGKGVLL
jgi:hypothetical protein